jgi:putative membrane protein
MLKYARNFLNGLAFGITETVPGVSGGTVAIILGFYFELIEAVNHFRKDMKKYLRFLIPLLLGMVTGIVMFGSVINYLLTHHSLPTMGFFMGLIVGIIPLIYDKVKTPGRHLPAKWHLTLLSVALLVAVSNIKGASFASPAEAVSGINAPFIVFIFVTGIIAAAALVIPGISGSFVMLLLGIYPLVTYAISNIPLWLTDMGNTQLLADIVKVLLPLGIGIIIGGLSMARLIEKLLINYHTVIYSVILGLLTGSVYSLLREPMVYRSGVSFWTTVMAAGTFTLGCVASHAMGKKKL